LFLLKSGLSEVPGKPLLFFPAFTTIIFMLKIAIQKSGRLHDDSVRLLRDADIGFSNGQGRLRAQAANFPLEIFYLRDDDIPEYVADGVADIGIVGENVLLEKGKAVDTVCRLGFGKCRLSLALPKNAPFEGLESLQGQRIATSYPRILQGFLQKNNIRATLQEISGSVEIAPSIGLADAVCDIVSSGSTLLLNGLREVAPVLHSEALLIATPALADEKAALLRRLQFRFDSLLRAKRYKYILLNAPNERLDAICRLLPGMKSPTVLPLAEAGWSSVHSVLHEDQFWDILEQLQAEGAQGILVTQIEKMIA
jgi:ATP phosphoribosyltransferase